jgi:predicted ATP-dependent protease
VTDPDKLRVTPEELRLTADPAIFEFECTDELTPLTEFVGQDRALRALQFGLGMGKPGYNIFVTGLTGTGKATAIMEHIKRTVEEKRKSGELGKPDDWCYVHNFEEPDCPNAIRLPAGAGKVLRTQMEDLLVAVKGSVNRALTSEDYDQRRKELLEAGQQEAKRLMEEAQEEAEKAGFLLRFSPTGVGLAPISEGKPLTSEEFAELDTETRKEIESRQAKVTESVAAVAEQLRSIERGVSQELVQLDHQVGENALAGLFDSIISQNQDHAEVRDYLQRLQEFSVANIDLLKAGDAQQAQVLGQVGVSQADPFAAFHCSVFVDNSQAEGPPIIAEPNPTWSNLFGKIERRAFLGTYFSDHTMLKSGSIHRANGGYIILNLTDVLTRPGSWDGLKRVIRTKEVRLEDPMEHFGMFAPQGLRPEPVPIDLKLVVAGDPMSYFLLSTHDEEFWEMFKVKADFDVQIKRTTENALAYAGFICATCQRDGLRHLDRGAVAKVVEQGSRMVDDQQRLSARFGLLRDLLVESDYWARDAGSDLVRAEHVQRAIDEKIYRLNLVAERLRELIADGVILVDVKGSVVGQVNGLAVLDFGEFRFGRPSRITGRTYLGQKGVTSIDRESQLTGRIHDKGVLSLSGYLGWKYAQDKPLSLSASISFEQAYEPVEGDSASLAELLAILSSVADVPLRQDLAVTGSISQRGEVQSVGGLDQKIEGFYDVCRAIGLTGDQGVVIPSRTKRNLMLREDVVQSVRDGEFSVYAVDSVDEALELLTGQPAGERGPDGKYAEGTISERVDTRLRRMGETMRQFGRPKRPEKQGEENDEEAAEKT